MLSIAPNNGRSGCMHYSDSRAFGTPERYKLWYSASLLAVGSIGDTIGPLQEAGDMTVQHVVEVVIIVIVIYAAVRFFRKRG